MDTCEQCGAVLDPAAMYCETCGWEYESPQYCVACGMEVADELEWGEEGLCISCAEELVGLP
jgi:uncharacterized OB-fold protein